MDVKKGVMIIQPPNEAVNSKIPGDVNALASAQLKFRLFDRQVITNKHPSHALHHTCKQAYIHACKHT
jgi:hypothetical protein